jgi:hypothetical protein
VLEGVEPEVREVGGILRVADAEDAALIVETPGKFHPVNILSK